MKLFASAAVAALLIASPHIAVAQPRAKVTGQLAQLPTVEIPHTTFKLSNGLTVIVHEDHKAPIVAVNIWYHVGSKNEPAASSGFAHLFEHLMFNGSENFNNDFFKATELLGATDQNGTTNTDRTNYFQNVPTSALDSILWLESDRMGHLVGAIDRPASMSSAASSRTRSARARTSPMAASGMRSPTPPIGATIPMATPSSARWTT
jgi:zinc protease